MATSGSADFQASYGSVVRGFHVYHTIWTPTVNEEHPTQREHGNTEDQYAVAITKNGVIIGHVPRELSRTFVAREGQISCKVTGQRQRSVLLQGRMEIPCIQREEKTSR